MNKDTNSIVSPEEDRSFYSTGSQKQEKAVGESNILLILLSFLLISFLFSLIPVKTIANRATQYQAIYVSETNSNSDCVTVDSNIWDSNESITTGCSNGISVSDIPEFARSYFQFPRGVYLDNSPEAIPQIREGDIITNLNGQVVDSMDTFYRIISSMNEGDALTARIYRDNSFETVQFCVPKS